MEEQKFCFVIVDHNVDNLIQCVGVYSDFAKAVGKAYLVADEKANENDRDKGEISQMEWLEEGRLGAMFTVRFKKRNEIFYVLRAESIDL